MSDFERQLPVTRLAQTHHGDTLQVIADREMGDANRWAELVWLNSLVPPYVVDDLDDVVPGVILTGSFIRVPAPVGVSAEASSNGQVFERDCLLQNKLLTSVDGDLSVVTGAANLRQQLKHRIDTPRGQMLRHPDYGCLMWRLVGTVNGPLAGKLGADYVRSALAADYRVSSVTFSKATVVGDKLFVEAQAKAVDGAVVDVVTR